MHTPSRAWKCIDHAWALLAPPACPACGRAAGANGLSLICSSCRPSLAEHSRCLRCGRPLPELPAGLFRPEECRACRGNAWAAEASIVVSRYGGPWRRAIIAFKHNPRGLLRRQLARRLSRLVRCGRLPGNWQAVVPVPRRHWTDSHPASLLALRTAQELELPCWELLRFARRTSPQRGLSRQQRLRNLRDAFRSKTLPQPGADLLIVDDVITTGTTVNECARALKRSGAGRIGVLALARGGTPA